MRIAGHQHVLVLLALLDELVEEYLHAVSHLHEFVAGEEFQIDQHLVVA